MPWRKPPKRAYKPRDPTVTSRMMSAVRGKNSKAEMALRREIWKRGYRYRLHQADLIGKPDLVFSRAKVAIFVDSDFWHARSLVSEGEGAMRSVVRGDRQEWWLNKLTRNVERDKEVTAALAAAGWTVVRIWESEILKDAVSCVDIIETKLLKGRH